MKKFTIQNSSSNVIFDATFTGDACKFSYIEDGETINVSFSVDTNLLSLSTSFGNFSKVVRHFGNIRLKEGSYVSIENRPDFVIVMIE